VASRHPRVPLVLKKSQYDGARTFFSIRFATQTANQAGARTRFVRCSSPPREACRALSVLRPHIRDSDDVAFHSSATHPRTASRQCLEHCSVSHRSVRRGFGFGNRLYRNHRANGQRQPQRVRSSLLRDSGQELRKHRQWLRSHPGVRDLQRVPNVWWWGHCERLRLRNVYAYNLHRAGEELWNAQRRLQRHLGLWNLLREPSVRRRRRDKRL